MNLVRVLVVEDHPIYRDGLAAAFADAPDLELVATVGTVRDATRVVETEPLHVVLLDLGLPDGSGLDAVATMRRRQPDAAIVVLTMHDDRGTVLQAVRAGAHGYLLKGAGRDDILTAVRHAAAGGATFAAGPAEVVLAAVSGTEANPAAALGLTAREGDVLRLLMCGLTNHAIAGRLGVTPKTVRNQVSSILAKLGVENRAAAGERARAAGMTPTNP